MKKTFQLTVEGKNRDRVIEAVKHEIRKYIQRERRKDLPKDADFWDFDCRFGATAEQAEVAHVATLTGLINGAVESGATAFYVELLAKPAQRTAKPEGEGEEGAKGGDHQGDGDDQDLDH